MKNDSVHFIIRLVSGIAKESFKIRLCQPKWSFGNDNKRNAINNYHYVGVSCLKLVCQMRSWNVRKHMSGGMNVESVSQVNVSSHREYMEYTLIKFNPASF